MASRITKPAKKILKVSKTHALPLNDSAYPSSEYIL